MIVIFVELINQLIDYLINCASLIGFSESVSIHICSKTSFFFDIDHEKLIDEIPSRLHLETD